MPAQDAAAQLRLVAPVRLGAIASTSSDEHGPPVEMFENPNLDRYLRRAQEFLAREDYAAAIQVLQDVVEGRTVEVIGSEEPPQPPADGDGGAAEESRPERARPALDARQAVFSGDGRLYRPVRRLCHELLAQLPDIGIELYRASHEVAAAELLSAAEAGGPTSALEEVVHRYFVTLAAGRAMQLLADRLMHEGRYRAAVQVLHDLVHVYPAQNRQRLGIDEVWCGFKAALCLRLAGEVQAARDAAGALAQRHPDATLRIEGELQAVAELPDGDAFAVAAPPRPDAAPVADATPRCVDASTEALVPIWQYRFADPEPYREPKGNSEQRGAWIVHDGTRPTRMPHAGRYGPATWVTFVPGSGEPTALFLEHYRLRVAAAETGLLRAEGDGPTQPPLPREGHPRVRIAACDFALLRPVVDDRFVYVAIGHTRNTTSSVETLKSSELVAYDRDTWRRAWSTADWQDGADGLRDVTFLAAPTVLGERLLVPALRREIYELRCLDRATGRPLWHTPIHAGGSRFFKAPGTPVATSGGVAFVLTNAGCLAAVDANTGDLRWIRRYERTDPLRPRPQPKLGDEVENYYGLYSEEDLTGFLPNELVVRDGLIVLAPIDSEMLLCLDGATGAPVWMLDATTHYARYGKLRELVGTTADALFFVADRALVCIGLHGGLVRWSRELPPLSGRRLVGRGRGTVLGDQVLVPGDREILVFDARGARPPRRLSLPPFGASRAPLDGSFDLTAHGPLLAAGFQGGVEVFGSRAALRATAAAADALPRRVHLLVEAGETTAAEQLVATTLREGTASADERALLFARLLQLTRARALELAGDGRTEAALAALDAIADLLPDRERRLEWHLARLDVCSAGDDLRAHEREQQRLYDYMEGRDPGGNR